MTAYDALTGLIEPIAKLAIEWQMDVIGWLGDADKGWVSAGYYSDARVDPQGNLTEEGETVDDSTYKDLINGWHESVRSELEPWTQLPDPAGLQGHIDDVRTYMNALLDPADVDAGDIDPESGDAATLGNGDLHSARGTIEAKLGAMQGETATRMYEKLVTKLDDVMRGEFAAAGVLGVHLTGQQQVLKATREDAVALFDACHEVMKERGAVGDGSKTLSIFGALVGMAGVFATGGLATALGAIGGAVGLGSAIADPAKTDAVELSLQEFFPEEVWAKMTEALDTLRDEMTHQESDLVDRSDTALGFIATSPGFDLSQYDGEGTDPSELGSAGDIVEIDEGGLEYIAENSLPDAAASLRSTAQGLEGIDPRSAMTRPFPLGLREDGIYTLGWSELRDRVVTCILGTATELDELTGGVIAVLADFGITDVEQAERYASLNG